MYGFSGYGTNEYGSRRFINGFAPVIKIAMTILRNTYGILNVLLLKFKNTTLEL